MALVKKPVGKFKIPAKSKVAVRLRGEDEDEDEDENEDESSLEADDADDDSEAIFKATSPEATSPEATSPEATSPEATSPEADKPTPTTARKLFKKIANLRRCTASCLAQINRWRCPEKEGDIAIVKTTFANIITVVESCLTTIAKLDESKARIILSAEKPKKRNEAFCIGCQVWITKRALPVYSEVYSPEVLANLYISQFTTGERAALRVGKAVSGRATTMLGIVALKHITIVQPKK
jgi:hypothetical protein